jgi:hypothetical protein
LVYLKAIGNILWSLGIFCGHLVYFSPFWYLLPRKIWQPWTEVDRVTRLGDCLPTLDDCFLFFRVARIFQGRLFLTKKPHVCVDWKWQNPTFLKIFGHLAIFSWKQIWSPCSFRYFRRKASFYFVHFIAPDRNHLVNSLFTFFFWRRPASAPKPKLPPQRPVLFGWISDSLCLSSSSALHFSSFFF